MTGRTAAVVSFRLGGADGVSVEAAKWGRVLGRLGFTVVTVAGDGKCDHEVRGLALDTHDPVDTAALRAALDGVSLVVVENVLSLPRNVAAARVLGEMLRGRPAVLHHHDLPWQRPGFEHITGWPLNDAAWAHVTINELSRRELATRGIRARCIYNGFDDAPPGRRDLARAQMGVDQDTRLVVQPTRAIRRKNVPAALRLAERLGAVYWLTGPAEDGYQAELGSLLMSARCPVHHGLPDGLTISDVYAAADLVAFPSTWEGFGNPVVESALHRRPLAVGWYPVLDELAQHGFRWFDLEDAATIASWLHTPDSGLMEHNARVARDFSLTRLQADLCSLLTEQSWL